MTDELGQLIDYGRVTYRPPTALHEHVVARDRTCRFPTCNRQARNCELDHVTAWVEGGETNAENLIALCSRHHHLKHEAVGWRVRRLDSGAVAWTNPSGTTTTLPGATYPVDLTASFVVSDDKAAIRKVSGPVVYVDYRFHPIERAA